MPTHRKIERSGHRDKEYIGSIHCINCIPELETHGFPHKMNSFFKKFFFLITWYSTRKDWSRPLVCFKRHGRGKASIGPAPDGNIVCVNEVIVVDQRLCHIDLILHLNGAQVAVNLELVVVALEASASAVNAHIDHVLGGCKVVAPSNTPSTELYNLNLLQELTNNRIGHTPFSSGKIFNLSWFTK